MRRALKMIDTVSRLFERVGALVAGIAVIVVGTGILIAFFHHHTVGAWVPIAVGVPLLVLVLVAYALGLHHSAQDPALAATAGEGVATDAVARAEYEKRLLTDALESVQQAIGSEQEWDIDDLVERGVLGPVRGLLVRAAAEDVRLAVLLPADDPPVHWTMRWAAGHRPESVRNYNREIDQTLAGLAFRRGDYVDRGDVTQDADFIPNPLGTRPFAALVAVPLRIESKVVGALSVVSTIPNAFSETDVSFIRVIGALLDVLLASEYDYERIQELEAAQEDDAGGG